jgi:hypothetical protein
MNSKSEEFTSAGVVEVVRKTRHLTAKEIGHAIVEAVEAHRAGFARNDAMTVVVVKMLVQGQLSPSARSRRISWWRLLCVACVS